MVYHLTPKPNPPTMRKMRPILFAFAAFAMMTAAALSNAEDKAPGAGYLVIRNGSAFATLTVNVYRLQGDTQQALKRDVIAPESTHIRSLPVGDYRATFDVDNGTAEISEAAFTIEPLADCTINFHAKAKR